MVDIEQMKKKAERELKKKENQGKYKKWRVPRGRILEIIEKENGRKNS